MNQQTVVIQFGHSRDGMRPSVLPCRARGCAPWLIDGPEGLAPYQMGEALGEPAYAGVVIAQTSRSEDLAAAAAQISERTPVEFAFAGYERFTVTAAEVTARYGRQRGPSAPDVIARFRHKALQRLRVERVLGPGYQPAFALCVSLEEALRAGRILTYPLVLKAEDGSGCRGVARVNDGAEMRRRFDEVCGAIMGDGLPANRRMLVERLIEGPEVGVCGLVDARGAVLVTGFNTKQIDPTDNCFLERRHLVHPPADIPSNVLSSCRAILAALELRASAFHMDMRLLPGGQPLLVETGARLSGDGLPELVRWATGVDWAALTLDAQFGGAPVVNPTRHSYAGLEFLAPATDPTAAAAALERSRILITRAGEEAEFVLYPADLVAPLGGGKAGFVRARAPSAERCERLLDQLSLAWTAPR